MKRKTWCFVAALLAAGVLLGTSSFAAEKQPFSDRKWQPGVAASTPTRPPDLKLIGLRILNQAGGEVVRPVAGQRLSPVCELLVSDAPVTKRFQVRFLVDEVPHGSAYPEPLPIAAGARRSVPISPPWTATAGEHHLKCHIDAENVIAERDEGDNVAYRTYFVAEATASAVGDRAGRRDARLAESKPDLSITGVAKGTNPFTQQTVANCTVKFGGNGRVLAPFKVAVFIGETKMGETTLTPPQPFGWAPGDTRVAGINVPGVSGAQWTRCLVDSENAIAESNEANNSSQLNVSF